MIDKKYVVLKNGRVYAQLVYSVLSKERAPSKVMFGAIINRLYVFVLWILGKTGRWLNGMLCGLCEIFDDISNNKLVKYERWTPRFGLSLFNPGFVNFIRTAIITDGY